MLLKLGVDISRLSRNCRRGLNAVESAFAAWSLEPVITSTFEGTHSPSSLHYANEAFDIRIPGKHEEKILDKIKKSLQPQGFDVVDEHNHWHIEYDPKGD